MSLLAFVLLVASVSVVATAPTSQAQGAQDEPGFVFTGGGWGHGVGMSQYGARAMGADGRSYQEILSHYYQGTWLGGVGEEISDLRVHLSDTNEVTMTTAGYISVAFNGVDVLATAPGTPVRVFVHDGGLQVGEAWLPVTMESPAIVSFNEPVSLSSTGDAYLWGKLQLTIKNGQVRVVESNLSMQRYVEGIAEMPAAWPNAALAAQAIAARTYAHNIAMDRRASAQWRVEYDISASTTDQHYIGWSAQDEAWDQLWVAAAQQTFGQYILHDDGPIRAYYSASSGGHTEHGALVFAYSGPWVTGVDDPWDLIDNPWSDWTRRYSVDELSRWFGRANDTSVGTLQSIEVTGGLGVSMRIDRATVTLTGSDGQKQVNGRRFMLMVNAGLYSEGYGLDRHLPGTLFTITEGPTGPLGSSADWIDPITVTETPVEVAAGDSAAPLAGLDLVEVRDGALHIAGWAFDPEVPDQTVQVQISVGEHQQTTAADIVRAELADTFVGGTDAHGFATSINLDPGEHRVCLEVIDPNGDANVTMTCMDLFVPDAAAVPVPAPGEPETAPIVVRAPEPIAPTIVTVPASDVFSEISATNQTATAVPIGAIDEVVVDADGTVSVKGWTFDPDTVGPVAVQVRVDTQAVATFWAAELRPDIDEEWELAGDRTGFETSFGVAPGPHELCVVLFNTGDGPDEDLPCASLTVK